MMMIARSAAWSIADLSPAQPSVLLDAYLARREDLRRYFALRLRSAEAAEDLVQDLYERVARGVDGAIGNPTAFLYRMGANLMLDRLKQQRRGQARDAGWQAARTVTMAGEEVAREPPADEVVAARQHLDRVISALNGLSPACRRVFRLHKLEGLTHGETAERLGISRSAVEKHISAALKHLMATVGRWE